MRNYQTSKVQKTQQYKTEATKTSILALLTLNAASFLADNSESPFSTYPPRPENWYIPWKLIVGWDDLPKLDRNLIPFLVQMKIPLKKWSLFRGVFFSIQFQLQYWPLKHPMFDSFKFKCNPNVSSHWTLLFFLKGQETHKAFFGAEMPQLSKKIGSPNLSAVQSNGLNRSHHGNWRRNDLEKHIQWPV